MSPNVISIQTSTHRKSDMRLSSTMSVSLIVQSVSTNFCKASSERLYFARDPLGRRSLLIHRPSTEMPYFMLSSVSDGRSPFYEFSELPSRNIFVLDLGRLKEHINVSHTYFGKVILYKFFSDCGWFRRSSCRASQSPLNLCFCSLSFRACYCLIDC